MHVFNVFYKNEKKHFYVLYLQTNAFNYSIFRQTLQISDRGDYGCSKFLFYPKFSTNAPYFAFLDKILSTTIRFSDNFFDSKNRGRGQLLFFSCQESRIPLRAFTVDFGGRRSLDRI